jgi:hypothetical protein
VVGTGVAASDQVRRELAVALEGLGTRPRAVEAGAMEVRAYAEARFLADAARELHRRLVE